MGVMVGCGWDVGRPEPRPCAERARTAVLVHTHPAPYTPSENSSLPTPTVLFLCHEHGIPVTLANEVTAAGLPPYRAIAEALRDRISGGEWKPGEQLPSRDTLAEQWRVSNQTMQHAFNLLREWGYTYSVQGRGTYVRGRDGEF